MWLIVTVNETKRLSVLLTLTDGHQKRHLPVKILYPAIPGGIPIETHAV